MGKFGKFLDEKLGGATDARWGVFATSFSLGWAFMAFAFSFYSIDGGKSVMPASGWMIAAWIFGVVGLVSLICAILVAVRWIRRPLVNTTSEELRQGFRATQDSIQELAKVVQDLTTEIRRDRDERSNPNM
ncbi:MAG: hypothetical protein HYZ24_16520 [Chloroflexi bacterium]|nr:hypothetical protein [Chloroflexota bacterium]